MSGGLDLVLREGQELLAGLDGVALLHVAGKAVAAHVDRVDAHVNEQLHAVGKREAHGVVGGGHGHRYHGIGGSDHGIGAGGGLDAQTVAHALAREDRVGHVVDGLNGAGDRADEGRGNRGGNRSGSLRRSGGSSLKGSKATLGARETLQADEVGECERHHDGDEHTDREDAPVLEHDGQDAGNTADADREGLGARARADHGSERGTDHAADQRELVLEVDTEERGLGNAEVARDARGDVDLLGTLVLLLQHGHGEHRRTLSDVGKRDHGPQGGVAEVVDHLGIDGVGHVMQTGHDERSVHSAEDRRKRNADVRAQAPVDRVGNGVANSPANGSDDDVRDKDRRHERHKRNDDHAHNLRADLGEELLEVHEHEGCHERGDDLTLVSGAQEREEPEVVGVGRDLFRRGGCHREAVEELRAHERQAEDDAEDGRRAHLAGNRPADADGQHVEHGLADDPQEAEHGHPELGYIGNGLGAVLEVKCTRIVKEVDFADDVAEAEDQTAADEGGDKRGKDLAENAHGSLERILVGACRRLGGLLRNALDAAYRRELLIEVGNVVADDDLKLTGLRKRTLCSGQLLDCLHVGLAGIDQNKTHARHAMRNGGDVLLTAYQLQEPARILGVLCHAATSLATYLNKLSPVWTKLI